MLLNVVFWILIAIDVAVLGLFFVLGLAAAGPSHTSPLAVIAFFAIPALIVLACVAVFVRSEATAWRVGALVLAASPVLLVAVGQAWAIWDFSGYQNADGTVNTFKAGPLRELESAIERNDVPAVAAAAKRAKLNEAGLARETPLLLAIRRLEKHPTELEAIQVLIDAGADVNSTAGEFLPLIAAIYVGRHAGPEPVKMLLKAGARPNQLDEWGTPAYFAAGGASVDVAILRLLLDAGADLKAVDRNGGSALMYATNPRNWKAVLLLLERGADWRKEKGFRERLESDERQFGDGKGLADVIQFVKKN